MDPRLEAGADVAEGGVGNGEVDDDVGLGYGTLMLVNPNGTGLVTVATAATNPDWSPDGRRLVYQSVRNGDSDLWTVNADGSGSKEITYSVGQDGDPGVVAGRLQDRVESNRNDLSGDVFVVSKDGTGTMRLTTVRRLRRRSRLVARRTAARFTSARTGSKPDLGDERRRLDQHALTDATRTSENPAWSPDGRTIAFDTDRTEPGNLDIWAMNADGSEPARAGRLDRARRTSCVFARREVVRIRE